MARIAISRLFQPFTTCSLFLSSGQRLGLAPSFGPRRYLSQRRPKPSTFKPKPSPNQTRSAIPDADEEPNNLTKLSFDAPVHLRRQALEMYAQCKLSERDPITRFAIARQMRNLDVPPHRELWQGINPKDELELYRWIDEAFGQLMYQKGLWKPSSDWSSEDDQAEIEQRSDNLNLLRKAYEEQILNPLKKRFGESEVTIALSNLSEDQKLYCQPAVVWQSVHPQTGEISLEWMSEYTADVAWPGLVSCQARYQIARRYWESEAREFAKTVGGVACGMGENGEMSPIETKEEQDLLQTDSSHEHQSPFDYQFATPSSSQANKNAAEAILIQKFLEERGRSKF